MPFAYKKNQLFPNKLARTGVILIDVRFDTLKSQSSCVLQPQCIGGARWLRLGSWAEGFDKLNRAARATLTSIKIAPLERLYPLAELSQV